MEFLRISVISTFFPGKLTYMGRSRLLVESGVRRKRDKYSVLLGLRHAR